MRSLVLPAVLCAAALNAQSVTDQYIELSVSDTITRPVKRIVYTYSLQGDEAKADAFYEEMADWEKVMKRVEKENVERLDKLGRKLDKEGFKRVDAGQVKGDFAISSYEREATVPNLFLEVASEKELKRLVAVLRAEGRGDGHVSDVEFTHDGDLETELLRRLHAKAELHARTLAELSGRRLGRMLNVTTPATTEENGFLKMIMEMGRREMMKGGDRSMFAATEKTLVFRFELLDK